MTFQRTFQTAGYVSPLGHSSGDDVRVQLTRGWAQLDAVACRDGRYDDYQQQYRTGLQGLMHYRAHQSEY